MFIGLFFVALIEVLGAIAALLILSLLALFVLIIVTAFIVFVGAHFLGAVWEFIKSVVGK